MGKTVWCGVSLPHLKILTGMIFWFTSEVVDDDTIVINLARDVLLESNKILVIVDFVVMIYLPLLFNCNLKKNMIGCLLMKLGIRMAFVE